MQPLCSHDTRHFSARRYEQRGDSRCRGWPVCSSDKAELASSWLDRQLALIKHIRLVSAWRHRESGSTLLLYRWLNLEPHFDSWCRDSWLTCSRPAHLLLSLLLFFILSLSLCLAWWNGGWKVTGGILVWTVKTNSLLMELDSFWDLRSDRKILCR